MGSPQSDQRARRPEGEYHLVASGGVVFTTIQKVLPDKGERMPRRIKPVAADLVAHDEKRLEAMDGKAMVVCMSRRICIDLYNELIALRPDWASAKDDDPEAEKQKATRDRPRLLSERALSSITSQILRAE